MLEQLLFQTVLQRSVDFIIPENDELSSWVTPKKISKKTDISSHTWTGIDASKNNKTVVEKAPIKTK